MKGILKVVCAVFIVLCLVAENESWWFGGSRSSRRSSSSSRRSSGSSWGSRSPSSSSTTRRGWTSRRTSRTSNFRIPTCSYRFGFGTGCYPKSKVDIKPTAGPTKAPIVCSGQRFGICREIKKPKVRRMPTWPYSRCPLRVGCIRGLHEQRKSPTNRPTVIRRPAPKVHTIVRKLPVKSKSPTKTSNCKQYKDINCSTLIHLLIDIIACAEKWKVTLEKPKSLTKIFAKKVVEMQVVEIPMGYCGSPTSLMYGEEAIKCLHCMGVKTSMSGKKDRVMHSGVVVKTEDGSKYLIHKGKKFGSNGHRTIIEKPNDTMYDKGYRNVNDPIKPKKLRSVKDYFKVSGNGYHFETDNCHDGTTRMRNLAKKPDLRIYEFS